MKKKVLLLFAILIFFIAALDVSLGTKLSLGKFLPPKIHEFAKKYFFSPFAKMAAHDVLQDDLKKMKGLYQAEKINHAKKNTINSLNNFNLISKEIKLKIKGYVKGNREKPMGYIDFIDSNLIFVTSYGDIFQVPKKKLKENYEQDNYHEIRVKNPIFKKELDPKKEFILIKSNLKKNYLLDRNYEKNREDIYWGNSYFDRSPKSITDIKVANGYLYVSFIAEITDRCFNVNVIRSKIDNYLNEMIFEDFFMPKTCSYTENILDIRRSGGRINYINNEIFLTTGEYRILKSSQDDNNLNGKIISINEFTKEYKVIGKGLRNSQGLALKDNLMALSDHGPYGGDEINLVKLKKNKFYNFGWPISSYGLHYDRKFREDAPLYKSHENYGFIEPLEHFMPGVGPSEVLFDENNLFGLKIDEKSEGILLLFTMGEEENYYEGDNSIHIFVYDKISLKITKKKIIHSGHRIRDAKIIDEKIYLVFDELGLGIIEKTTF